MQTHTDTHIQTQTQQTHTLPDPEFKINFITLLKNKLTHYKRHDFINMFYPLLKYGQYEYCIKLNRFETILNLQNISKRFTTYFREHIDYIYLDNVIHITKNAFKIFCIKLNTFESMQLYHIFSKMESLYYAELIKYKDTILSRTNLELNVYKTKFELMYEQFFNVELGRDIKDTMKELTKEIH
jgi:hypothetical protein